jgi:beta-glucosidase
MQGDDHPSGILKTVTTPKHFQGQTFEGDGSNPWGNGTTVNRQDNDTRYPVHDLEAYYLPAFKSAMVDAGAGSVMCAYQGRCIGISDAAAARL